MVLAGGKSRRFGSDKALAVLAGQTLLDRAVESLSGCSDAVTIVGRGEGVADWPTPGLGPLGGIAGALRHAGAAGFDQILTIAVDCVLPLIDLRALLAPAPAYVAGHPVVGLWPVGAIDALAGIDAPDADRSIRAFAARVGARAVACPAPVLNINTPDDLLAAEAAVRA